MAGSRIPGPLGAGENYDSIDDGTLARTRSPRHGALGLESHSLDHSPRRITLPRAEINTGRRPSQSGDFDNASVTEWTLPQKFTAALQFTLPKLPMSLRHEFATLINPASIGIMVGTLVAWAGSHAFGVGEIIDVVLLLAGTVFLGFAVRDVAGHVSDFIQLTCAAKTESDLNAAAAHLAQVIAVIGVAAFAALMTKGARRVSTARAAPSPPPKPAVKEPGPKIARRVSSSDAPMTDILKREKGDRPLPSTYLDQNYIKQHLAKFNNGASFITKKSTLERYGRKKIGMPDNSQFVMPKSQMDEVLTKANGDISVVERELGIPKGAWQGDELVRIDIPNIQGQNLRMPSGNEMGANEHWLPGGNLPTGYDEAVINQAGKGTYLEGPLWK